MWCGGKDEGPIYVIILLMINVSLLQKKVAKYDKSVCLSSHKIFVIFAKKRLFLRDT